jgi:hypothetical protein
VTSIGSNETGLGISLKAFFFSPKEVKKWNCLGFWNHINPTYCFALGLQKWGAGPVL